MKSIFDLEHLVFINLAHREDRKLLVEQEIRSLGFTSNTIVTRFNAVKLKNGALGCSMSHLKVVEMAKEQGWKHVLICEDDIQFLNVPLFRTQVNKFLANNDENNWDVLLLAGNNMLPYTPVDDCCIQVHNCITTTGYLVQQKYYDTLIDNYKKGIANFMKEPEAASVYSIDKYWLPLQMRDKWFLIVPLTVIQRENYSDIEGKVTNFRSYMLDYNKVIKRKT